MVAFQEIADKYITADIPGKLFAGFGFGIAQIQNNVAQVVFVGTLAEALAFKFFFKYIPLHLPLIGFQAFTFSVLHETGCFTLVTLIDFFDFAK